MWGRGQLKWIFFLSRAGFVLRGLLTENGWLGDPSIHSKRHNHEPVAAVAGDDDRLGESLIAHQ